MILKKLNSLKMVLIIPLMNSINQGNLLDGVHLKLQNKIKLILILMFGVLDVFYYLFLLEKFLIGIYKMIIN
jgi:hypothetical protein